MTSSLDRLPLSALHEYLRRFEEEVIESIAAACGCTVSKAEARLEELIRQYRERAYPSDPLPRLPGFHEDESDLFWDAVAITNRRKREEITRLREECAA